MHKCAMIPKTAYTFRHHALNRLLMKIAFYCPLKSPNHPVPSGDRLMARLLMAALERAGHQVEIASELRAFMPEASSAAVGALAAAAEAEVRPVSQGIAAQPGPPSCFPARHSPASRIAPPMGPSAATASETLASGRRPPVVARATRSRSPATETPTSVRTARAWDSARATWPAQPPAPSTRAAVRSAPRLRPCCGAARLR